MNKSRRPSLWLALVPVVFLIGMLFTNVLAFGDDTLSFSNQLVLLAAGGIAGIIGLAHGHGFASLMDGVVDNIKQAIPALLILLLIGALAGSWMISGIVPAMIYYGMKVLHPDFFLVSATIICAVVSIATGSSWGTIATIGIALLGIGNALGFHEGLVAGAIISGAYFGDKMSPLSDTTNLAPAVAGTDIFTHIRYMAITTIPSILITLVIFTVIGLTITLEASTTSSTEVEAAISSVFNLNPLLFLVPLAVIAMIIKRIPAAPALAVGTLLGAVFALIFQQDVLASLNTDGSTMGYYRTLMQALGTDFSLSLDNAMMADLLSTGGMAGMLHTIWLIICAMIFGGTMERSKCLEVITQSLLGLARGKTSLTATTGLSALFMNATASDQYLAIVVPGKMYSNAYKEKDLAPENLSRTLEDCGTVTSVLIPWNTCGATQAGVLGVATVVYWPFCFFCLISPFMNILVSAINFRIQTLRSTKASQSQ